MINKAGSHYWSLSIFEWLPLKTKPTKPRQEAGIREALNQNPITYTPTTGGITSSELNQVIEEIRKKP
jgi:hypothetical protein